MSTSLDRKVFFRITEKQFKQIEKIRKRRERESRTSPVSLSSVLRGYVEEGMARDAK